MLRRSRQGSSEGAPEPKTDRLLARADEADRRIVEQASQYSMTGAARLLALIDAVRYCQARAIPGAFVECGVWRGGSVLTMLLTLLDLGSTDRDVYLYDTFEGMTEPSDDDLSPDESWEQPPSGSALWPEVFRPELVSEEAVRQVLAQVDYPAPRLHFVRGPVEDTIPGRVPESIALLRLDTDWYESTRHELIHLFPRLQPGGVLIIDDYGHWHGAKKAVDEYFAADHPPILLNRIDYTARIAIKN